MLKGHVFDLQTFTSNAFALFIDKFLNKQSGVATGCNLSNTNNSVTIADGYFVIKGRFLQVISGVTINNINTDGFYKLICEIDLSKTNTTDTLNQAEIKTVYNASAYPTLTQQDLIEGNGTVYQYEFARFKVESGSITDFTDKRTFVSYGQILTLVQNELEELEQQSNVSLKSDFVVLTGIIPGLSYNDKTYKQNTVVNFPEGFTKNNCVVVSAMASVGGQNYFAMYDGRLEVGFHPVNNNIEIDLSNCWGADMEYKIVLMKVS